MTLYEGEEGRGVHRQPARDEDLRGLQQRQVRIQEAAEQVQRNSHQYNLCLGPHPAAR